MSYEAAIDCLLIVGAFVALVTALLAIPPILRARRITRRLDLDLAGKTRFGIDNRKASK